MAKKGANPDSSRKAEAAPADKTTPPPSPSKESAKKGLPIKWIALVVILAIIVATEYELIYARPGAASGLSNILSTTSSTGNAIKPPVYTVNLATNATVGKYLTNATGWSLYTYTGDVRSSGKSACYGSCATYWPPFYSANISVPSGLSKSSFGSIKRTDGTMQTTYDGAPLYLYVGDKAPGQVKGQGVAGTWYAAIPVPPKTTTSTTTRTTTSTSMSTSSTTTSTSTTTVPQTGAVMCQTHDFLRVNESLSCPPVKLTLVDVGQGNQKYEISNAIVDIYLNGNLTFTNESLLQSAAPYWLNFSNGHNAEIYVYQATYSYYPVGRSANISIAYR